MEGITTAPAGWSGRGLSATWAQRPAPSLRQVVAAGRRRFFYHLDLAGGSVERVAGVFGRDDKSLESFVASHDQERPGGEANGFAG